MKVSIKRFDKTLPLPEYKTAGAAAFDLSARVETTIPAGVVQRVPLNIALQLPKNYFALVSARSSLHKKGLMMANGIGIGDYDYRGDDDEYQAALYNFSARPVIIERGERIVQMIILERELVELIEKSKFNSASRGGFGSTGR
ncbi:MAG TPA: dUTP diphosphatase [Patescibacteria group bacterium]|jgi:dUTP pyrophosphatase